MNNILVIRSGAIGDIIMATPFLRNLRENFPKSEISFLVGEYSKKVLKNNPNVDEIISFDDEIIIKKRLIGAIKLIKKLRKRRFDLCFILDKSWLWNLFAFLCGIKKRVGFSRGNEGILNTASVPFDGSISERGYYLELLKIIGLKAKDYQPEIFSEKNDIKYAKNFVRKIGRRKIIGITPGGAVNPGQKAPIKRWPINRYIELTDKIKSAFIIFGDDNDKELAREIMEKSKNRQIYDATGLSIQKTKEIMSLCNVIVAHDSGAMHIASTTKTKLIALFGPTPAERFAPGLAIVIKAKCKPCYTIYGRFENCDENCMESIHVEEVIKYI